MKIVGIICEYDPLHLGHKRQLSWIRQKYGEDCAIVCLMSGNYVQRGKPAIVDKSIRAKAAVLSGADLVLELPVTASVSSAEGFAAKGVSLLGGFCGELCFGAETNRPDKLLRTAEALLSPEFSCALRLELDKGSSFPAARQAALDSMGLDGSLLSTPNNILAVEYCKAIKSQKIPMQPLPILRPGSYHAHIPDLENPSATAVRQLMLSGKDYRPFIPEETYPLLENAPVHSLAAGERAILARLRTMADEEFEALPYGSEGLWRKLMHASRGETDLQSIISAVKSKRYTRSRIDRMILCAFLGLTQQDLDVSPPYARVLALNHRGREILKQARSHGLFPNAGEKLEHPYQAIENRCEALYGLFTVNGVAPPVSNTRVQCIE